MAKPLCTVEIFKSGKFKITDGKGNVLPALSESEVAKKMTKGKFKKVVKSPLFTYLEANSGLVYIGGRWVWVP